MPRSRTEPSTPRLSEYARKFVYPDGISRTVWTRVEVKGAELGLGFDWWQSQAGTVCLGYGEDGKYVATVGGIGLSIPRQVGKTYFVLATIVVLCILFPGLQVVWTAHHLRTSTKTFTSLRGICRRKKVAPHVKALRAANGEQQVEFVNGSMIMFGARSMGFGRGFDEIDIEVFDEAQILDTKALEDMIAATNQARHEHGALLFFMGTPPRPSDPSGAFTARRADAWEGRATDAVWLEIGADPKSDADDRSQWPLMNPSYPKRTPLESMLRLRRNLSDEDSWNREGRGIWDSDDGVAMFKKPRWAAVESDSDVMESVAAFAVEAQVNWATSQRRVTIAAAGPCGERIAVEVVERIWSTDAVIDRLTGLAAKHGCRRVVFDDGGGAADLIPAAKEAGLDVVTLTTKEVAAGTAAFIDGVTGETVWHGPERDLEDAVFGAKPKAYRDGGFLLAAKKQGSDITPAKAVVLAHWVAKQAPPTTPQVWSIREMVDQLKQERAAGAAEGGQGASNTRTPQARPDGSTFIPL